MKTNQMRVWVVIGSYDEGDGRFEEPVIFGTFKKKPTLTQARKLVVQDIARGHDPWIRDEATEEIVENGGKPTPEAVAKRALEIAEAEVDDHWLVNVQSSPLLL
jgi:hypothetical protein